MAYNLTVKQEDQDIFEARGDGRTLPEAVRDHERDKELSAVLYKEFKPAGVAIRYSEGIPPGARKIRILAGGFLALLCGSYMLAAISPEARNTIVLAVCAVGLLIALYLIFSAIAHHQVRLDKLGLVSRPKPFGTGPKVKATFKQIRRFRVKKAGKKKKRYNLMLVDRDRREHLMVKNIPRKPDAYLMALLLIEHTKRLDKKK